MGIILKITELSELELLHGSITLIFILISFAIGFIFLFKYYSTNRIEYITLGLSWIFLSSAWWGSSFSFLSILFINKPLDDFTYILLGNVFLPVAVVCWIYSISHLLYTNKEKVIVFVFLIICVPYDISIIILLLINPSLVGKKIAIFNYTPSPYAMAFQIFAGLVALITGIIFSIKSLKMENKKIKIHAKLLLIAFLSFNIAALLDSILPLSEIPLVIIRVILISSAIEYYFGWFLPKRLEKLLINE